MQNDTRPLTAAPAPASTAIPTSPQAGEWSAVFALTLCVGTLIASEFMPVSLLTPIAGDLGITEGQAGQAIGVSGFFAVLTSLFISTATRRIDRRTLLLALTVVMFLSGVIVALAPSFEIFMAGRALIGIVIGGFWSMSASLVMRLVPDNIPRGLALLNGGNALATTIAAPLGSFLGQYIGWRGAFFCIVPLAAMTFVWLFLSLPSLPARGRSRASATFRILARPNVPMGILAVSLLFVGQFILFTYLRPFLEGVTRLDVSTLSMILLGMGLSGLLGNYLVGHAAKRNLNGLLIGLPMVLAAIAIGLVAFGSCVAPTALLLGLWGMAATAAPVGWWTWLSNVLPNDAEAGGGLMVAAIQLSITLGASIGGMLFDRSGYQATFAVAAAVLFSSATVAVWAARRTMVNRIHADEDPISPSEAAA